MDLGKPFRPRRRMMWPWLVLLACVAGFVATFAISWLVHRPTRMSDAQAWTPKGPPCPTLTAGEFTAKRLKVHIEFVYREDSLGRATGHVSCNVVDKLGLSRVGAYSVCQFTSPGVLVVTPAGKPATYFQPGIGHPATITIRDGVPACVLASNFTL